MMGEISSSSIFSSSIPFLIEPTDRIVLKRAQIAAILAKLFSLSWQALAIPAWSSNMIFYYAIVNRASFFLTDHWMFETEPMLWELGRRLADGGQVGGGFAVAWLRLELDLQVEQVEHIFDIVVGLVK